MAKKIVAFFTSVTFIVLIISCSTMEKINPELGKENEKVYAIEKITGEHIHYPKKKPAVIHNKSVQSKQDVKKETEITIERKAIKKVIKNGKGENFIIQTEGGIGYRVLRTLSEDSNGIKILAEINVTELFSVSFDELRAIWIPANNALGTLLIGIASAIVLVFVIASIMPKQPEYTYPGKGWD